MSLKHAGRYVEMTITELVEIGIEPTREVRNVVALGFQHYGNPPTKCQHIILQGLTKVGIAPTPEVEAAIKRGTGLAVLEKQAVKKQKSRDYGSRVLARSQNPIAHKHPNRPAPKKKGKPIKID